MNRLEATGEYTEDEINALARGGKLRGHISGVGRVLPSRATSRPSMPEPDKSLKSMHRKVDFMMSLFISDYKYSDMFKEFESGGASGSGGCGVDEESQCGPSNALGLIIPLQPYLGVLQYLCLHFTKDHEGMKINTSHATDDWQDYKEKTSKSESEKVATVIAIYTDWEFTRIKRVGWKCDGVTVFYFPLDIMKFAIRYTLSGKA
ncbi:hypothetical protein Tco_0683582 [Tanacetum coccineum]